MSISKTPASFKAAKRIIRGLNGQMPDHATLFGWWSQTGSNRRPEACKATALPTELWPRSTNQEAKPIRTSLNLVGLGRLELPTSRLSSARSNQLSYKPGHCKTARFLARSAPCLRHMRKPEAGSSFVEERETKTAASRKIGLTGRMFQVFQ